MLREILFKEKEEKKLSYQLNELKYLKLQPEMIKLVYVKNLKLR